jgi:hypothetical protein
LQAMDAPAPANEHLLRSVLRLGMSRCYAVQLYGCVRGEVTRLFRDRLYVTSPGKSTLLLISWPDITMIPLPISSERAQHAKGRCRRNRCRV